MTTTYADGRAVISGLSDTDINQIFDCGQCFRFDPSPRGGIEGIAGGHYAHFTQNAPDTLEIECERDDIPFWTRFLSLDVDYSAVKADISSRFGGDTIAAAIKAGAGIRILRQDAWETLISFIISQNNNIPRIKKLIAALSERCGERLGDELYAFPTPKAVCDLGEDGLFALKTGFRAGYIFDCASRVLDGRLDLEAAAKLDTPALLAKLCEVRGIGPKVASCAALFGFNRTEAFPIDVWVKRVLAKYYPDGLDIAKLGAYAGIAQQYLFYYERYNVK